MLRSLARRLDSTCLTLRILLRATALGGISLTLAAGGLASALGAATIVVDTLADTEADDGLCSLREAILAANDDLPYLGCPAGSGADQVTIDLTGNLPLTSDLPVITRTLKISGPASGTLNLSGGNHRMLYLNGTPNGRTLRIERLTVRNGENPTGGGCITARTGDHLEIVDSRVTGCESAGQGGGIFGDFAASITLQRSSVDGNLAALGAGGVYLLGEGLPRLDSMASRTAGSMAEAFGAEPTAFLLVEDSTISANTTVGEGVGGGVVFAWANGEIRRSTVSGNSTADSGGGVGVLYGHLLIAGSTITGNIADSNLDDTEEVGGGLLAYADVLFASTIELWSTVVAGNLDGTEPSDLTAGPNSAILSQGGNLIGAREGGAAAFPLGSPNGNGDWVGSRAVPTYAALTPLADNGGATKTHAPSPGSLLVDHGDCPEEFRDQRGYGDPATMLRAVDNPLVPDSTDGCDIGAFETDGSLLPVDLFRDGFETGDTATWSATAP